MNSLSTNFIVPAALWLLGIFSVITWTLIVVKAVQGYRAAVRGRRFGRQFWQARSFQAAAGLDASDSPVGRVAAAGFNALDGADESGADDLEHSWSRHDLLERHLRQQIQNERRRAEAGLAVLASIGSTAPFVGLFGTVFGIIHALSAISHAASASIDVVAGPIGEALVATGIGIAVAVPAVLAYNFFVRRVKGAAADLDAFATDFVTLAQKAGFRARAAGQRAAPVLDTVRQEAVA
ncbi:MotA/TolQ/ExbB proton channel family protein [Paraburkholderia caballeronis]|uniref:Outer membrane transport energization protein ExbB n=1 Tax=Paraburkholderia caballeronis TaxID=416943 RepID=A0A1H7LXJ6_9BURK|nr:MotA/TolQ/ExbB proton channel family protein [Paraburkholderia caballeronis]PXW28627.1 outer membrane transport energization protein ExbB [Paraburkholderia caballeronis]PXX03993.1 outer membrane transport energization protein ExbB [Paraburkholderia caballeronis]RAK04737.1 outer membrane transport energization protein ExbB [Paraburkholderia caballeronis]TDV19638.1 outer membrane transport energization protein ExbB [Paraburkholderia caballeronis]TDV22237.1 outer membrane transport energizatio